MVVATRTIIVRYNLFISELFSYHGLMISVIFFPRRLRIRHRLRFFRHLRHRILMANYRSRLLTLRGQNTSHLTWMVRMNCFLNMKALNMNLSVREMNFVENNSGMDSGYFGCSPGFWKE
jgi:hypothetical protein